ncbi:O-methyltransferase [Rhizomicrobium electricum]|uniref:O-methyltransferase n=1 Tax=Rhizomicrobium electricum TaxID=480070 RepID=A0ABN1FD93_9PROT|nr:class I SAM-dependent methyltransferase [Rhizomicrobium electricum]NIJ49134.1 putative O-methyltransferase YrrM [Rhizomicrobium electricum]
MTALLQSPIAPEIARLLAEAHASEIAMNAQRAAFTGDPTGDYRDFYARTKDFYLAVAPETARLLYVLARATNAQAAVEFGASFGVSTLHLAAALKDTGGRLITTEFEPAKAAQLRKNLAAAGIADLVDVREGDALETLARDLPARIDLVLLDGAKPLYPKILKLLEPHFGVGTLVVADNSDMCPDYVAVVRETANGYLSLPCIENVELSLWIGR